MSGLVEQTINLLCNSDSDAGALNKSPDGSSFVVQLDTPIRIPQEAVGCTLSVTQASIWNISFNISAEIANNILAFNLFEINYTITIPDGMYSIEGFNLMIARELAELGLDSDIFIFTGDESSSKVVIQFNQFAKIDFTVANSCRELLGFESRIVNDTVVPVPGTIYFEVADNVARFNRINSYIIQSDIVGDGIPINSSATGVIANVPINVKPGRLIVYSPVQPTRVDAMELVGHSKNRFDIRLRDQNARTVNTVGESFTVLLELRYYIPHKSINAF